MNESWTGSMNHLKNRLFASQAVEATVNGGTKIEGFLTPVRMDKGSDASVATLGQLDFITEASYKPHRGDLLAIGGATYRVKERDNRLYRECDNAGSLIRVFVQKE